MPAPPPEQVAHVRAQYLRDVPYATIKRESNLHNAQLHACLAGKYDDGSGLPLKPLPLRKRHRRKNERADQRTKLTQQLWRAAERQVREVEERLRAAGLPPTERERDARTLAVLVKTVRDLSEFDARRKTTGAKEKDANQDANDPVPRNVDDLRRELARRLDQLVAEAKATYPTEA